MGTETYCVPMPANRDEALLLVQSLVDEGRVPADLIDKVKQIFSADGGLQRLAQSDDVTGYIKAREQQERRHGNKA